LIVPTQYVDVAVDAFECDQWAAAPDAHGSEPVVPVDELSVAPLRNDWSARHDRDVEMV
jgi:hypothetical protein